MMIAEQMQFNVEPSSKILVDLQKRAHKLIKDTGADGTAFIIMVITPSEKDDGAQYEAATNMDEMGYRSVITAIGAAFKDTDN